MISKKRSERSTERRIDIAHHHYRIVGGQGNGSCQAIAYIGKRKIYTTAGETVAAAVESLKVTLDEHLARLRQERVGGVPSACEFREALLALVPELPEKTIGLLVVHSRLPRAVATIGDLSRCSGQDEVMIGAGYARLGRKLSALLNFFPEPNGLDQAFTPVLTFAFVEMRPDKAGAALRLRPEVFAALGDLDEEQDTLALIQRQTAQR